MRRWSLLAGELLDAHMVSYNLGGAKLCVSTSRESAGSCEAVPYTLQHICIAACKMLFKNPGKGLMRLVTGLLIEVLARIIRQVLA